MRTAKVGNLIEDIEKEAEEIFAEFSQFSEGARMIMLLERKKDGGHNKEELRNLATRFTFSGEEYKRAIRDMLVLQLLYPESRMYTSVNPRKMTKVIQQIERELLELHYCKDDVQVEYTHKKLIKSPRHFFMQPQCADGSLFVIDVDDEEGIDSSAEALKEAERVGVEILKTYKTKNGWHFVTKPFNPALWTHKSEVKKDALILLNY